MMRRFVICCLLVVMSLGAGQAIAQPPRVSWMRSAGFGVMIHHLIFDAKSFEDYEQRLARFDVEVFAGEVEHLGAGYVILTLGQNSGYYLSPNATYERLVGAADGRHSALRDLPMELGKALAKRGIRLVLYLPSRSPQRDPAAMAALGDVNQREPAPQQFIANWSAICREWSLRYGKLVSGWWFDGYYAPEGWADLNAEHNWKTWAQAVRAGNPEAEIAFNRGAGVQKAFLTMNDAQTYTAGEMRQIGPTPRTHPAPDGVQWHLLTYLGKTWGAFSDQPRYDAPTLLRYIDTVNAEGGCVSLDVRVTDEGHIQPVLYEALLPLGAHREQLTNGRLDESITSK